ncbi:MAG: hypothetical protein AAB343_02885 [Patescibacteria group bacterium]
MTNGMLFMALVAGSIALIAIAQFYYFLRKRDLVALNIHLQALFFSLFWFIIGIVWMFTGFSDFLLWKGKGPLSYNFSLLSQIGIGIALVTLIIFFHARLQNRRALWLLFIPLMSLALIFTWSVFVFGLQVHGEAFFTNTFVLTKFSQELYAIAIVPALFVAGLMMLRALFDQRIPHIERKFVLFATLSVMVLAISGSLEEMGIATGAVIPVTRLLALASAMAAYIASTSIVEVKGKRRELVI